MPAAKSCKTSASASAVRFVSFVLPHAKALLDANCLQELGVVRDNYEPAGPRSQDRFQSGCADEVQVIGGLVEDE